MRYIEYSHPLSEGAANGYAYLKQALRIGICGLLFAVPISAAVPTSPLMRLSMSKNNQKAVMTRMMSDFFYVNFFASSIAYAVLIETRLDKQCYGGGILPALGPLSAQLPAVCCLCASHLFYPGAWAIINETTWKSRRQTFIRLNAKCFVAFAPYHIPALTLLGGVVGLLMFPFKYYKRSRFEKQIATPVSEQKK